MIDRLTRSIVHVAASAVILGLGACGVGGALALSGGGGGGGGTPQKRPRPPEITVAVPANGLGSNFVSIPFVLRDPRVKSTIAPPEPGVEPDDSGRDGGEDDPRVRIIAEYRAEGSNAFLSMTDASIVGSDGLRGLALGSHTFVWNTVVDLPGFVGDVTVRIRAEYEPTAGFTRKFGFRDIRFRIDNRLAATVFGGDVFEVADIDTFPVDLFADGDFLLIASSGAGIVEQVDDFGRIRRVVGLGVPGDTGDDGDPGVARLANISGVAIDPVLNLVFTQHGNRIRTTNASRNPRTVADTVIPPRTITTLAPLANITNGQSVRIHPSGLLLYIDNLSRIVAYNPRPVPPGGGPGNEVTFENAVIGPGQSVVVVGGGADTSEGAEAENALISAATSLAVDPQGAIYYVEFNLGRVRVYNPGPAPLNLPASIGSVAPGTVRTVVGGGGAEPVRDGDGGPALSASLAAPRGIDVRYVPAAGLVAEVRQLFVADTANARVRMVNLGSDDSSFAGTTVAPGDIDRVVGTNFSAGESGGGVGSPAASIQLGTPNAVSVGVSGTIVIADQRRVIMVNGTDATITAYGKTALSTRTAEIYDASRRTGLPLAAPTALHSRGSDEVFLADRSTVRVLNLDTQPRVYGGASATSGGVSVIAGGAVPGFDGDGGSARSAAFDSPAAIVADGALLLYVADTGNDRVRVINIGDPNLVGALPAFGVSVFPGFVDTVVGGGPTGLVDDGDLLAPQSANLDGPQGLAVFGGLLFVSDTGHHRVRCVNPGTDPVIVAGVEVPGGTIRTILGDGTPGDAPDGTGPWQTNLPTALAIDGRGILYVAESGNHRIRALNLGLTAQASAGVTLAGVSVKENELATLVGDGTEGNFGDGGGGPEARIDNPTSLLVQTLADGTPVALYFADADQHVVRVLNLIETDLIGAIDSDRRPTVTIPGGGIISIAGGPNAIGISNAPAFAGDGEEATEMRFSTPRGIAITNNASLPAHFFVADSDNNRLRRFGAPPLVNPGADGN